MGQRYSFDDVYAGLRGKHRNLSLKALLFFLSGDFRPKNDGKNDDALDHILRYSVQHLLHWYVLVYIDRSKRGRIQRKDMRDFLQEFINTLDKDFTQVKVDMLRRFVLQQLLIEDVRPLGHQTNGLDVNYQKTVGELLNNVADSDRKNAFYRFRSNQSTIPELARQLVSFARDLDLPDEDELPAQPDLLRTTPTKNTTASNKRERPGAPSFNSKDAIISSGEQGRTATTSVTTSCESITTEMIDSAGPTRTTAGSKRMDKMNSLNQSENSPEMENKLTTEQEQEREQQQLHHQSEHSPYAQTAPGRESPVLIEEQVELVFRLLARDAFDLNKRERDKLMKALEYEAKNDQVASEYEKRYPGEVLYSAKKLVWFVEQHLQKVQKHFLWEETVKQARKTRNEEVSKGKVTVALCGHEQWTMGKFVVHL